MNNTAEVKKSKTALALQKTLFGQEMSFAAREAYKLLRTNLLFSLPETEEGRGHVIGVTSSLRGEGKSTTTVNLAATLAEQGARVLVVEGDLRLPSLHKKLDIVPKPGLSNVLVSRSDPTPYLQTVQVGEINGIPVTFEVLAAGDIPPNPSELIGSNRMKRRMEQLAQNYHFILLDLPPVTAVTDALVASQMTDGIVMVVRNEHTDRGSLNEAMRQLRLVDAKLLGFVYTCAGTSSAGYKKYKYKYRYKYYKGYGYDYGYGYGYGDYEHHEHREHRKRRSHKKSNRQSEQETGK